MGDTAPGLLLAEAAWKGLGGVLGAGAATICAKRPKAPKAPATAYIF